MRSRKFRTAASRTTRGSCARASEAATRPVAAAAVRRKFLREVSEGELFFMRAPVGRACAARLYARYVPRPAVLCSKVSGSSRRTAEVLPRLHPRFEPGALGRPVAIRHREPRAVAIAALDDHMLAEHALEREAEL